MLELKNIKKDYVSGDTTVQALKGVSLQFRDSEFVAILGQSGCGKTTLLNIIGGLDQYTSGDLVINGTSTKKYMDRDWDSYRNHSVGFVFQSYNLIPHQTVLANVELALTLSGVSRGERKKRAEQALIDVGLGEQMHKRPNQLSGGQMQRVAIARALVNDPSIVLADEPTGALDTETSVQVMDILRQVAKDRLVIMVTHNPELAEEYADRIVVLRDGVIQSDTDPYEISEEDRRRIEDNAQFGSGRTSMSMLTAFSLSVNNLLTKKGRTILTAFAGSIGIIGIALILSLSSGAQNYINEQEEAAMGQYPITIQETSMNLASLIVGMSGGSNSEEVQHEEGVVPSFNFVTDMVTSIVNDADTNDMESIKSWLESNPDDIQDYVTDIQYSYKTPINIYAADTEDGLVQVNPATVMDSLGISTAGSTQSAMLSSMSAVGGGYDVWLEMLDNPESFERDFTLVEGSMPEAWNEVVIVLDEYGSISDYTLYSLGLLDQAELKDLMTDAIAGKKVKEFEQTTYTYDELMALEFKLLPQTAYYEKGDDDTWVDRSDDDDFVIEQLEDAEVIKVVGIVQATEDSSSNAAQTGGILYRRDLMEHAIQLVEDSEIVQEQKANANNDVFTGYAFPDDDEDELTMESIDEMIAEMPSAQGDQVRDYIDQLRDAGMTDDEIVDAFQKQMAANTADASYEGNLEKLGVSDVDSPFAISIYPRDFNSKEVVDQIIADYNDRMEASGEDDQVIHYTDIVGTLMSSVTSIVNSITYILIAFVAISLVVSSIMIGIITYISVLERTKEIGILRSIGASKKDISRVFNAETFIIGLLAGLLGVGLTVLLDIPVNIIIEHVSGVKDMAAVPAGAGAALVAISVLLTLIGGIIPSRMAAKKDPVTALRTE
ncbi:Macrolide export ATP-binding/permease protein MacB [Slackia heliotrinireducens]|uniref:ABC-type antimicrobial peptide transport system, ATPase component n=1 Tax=Slackia heliotrinireducens (strain ATCC 29202 / DSM 20476 / NCTC 11029 / RHS 1) TaxID=471855 RepID=C7N3K7_SLAHD|nr:ABC transporter ATP-binding protein/permease [Slackia heliotrinireducens]ACV23730.1 ABC-type antimicrobial peptide transport system, ATPase component [Slackia heliotrinireducens DSM 20476]VEH03327.1 Macrolide export ATP-binding/permease protein MacB [Slackia heliotrinireducens]